MEIRRQEGTKLFSFDRVYSPSVNQADIFEKSEVASLLDSVVSGMSATILAYGQTGSGKTFTWPNQLVGEGRQAEGPGASG